MAQTQVTMSKEDLEQAVLDWAKKHMNVDAKDIVIATEKYWAGYGANEYESYRAKVTFSV